MPNSEIKLSLQHCEENGRKNDPPMKIPGLISLILDLGNMERKQLLNKILNLQTPILEFLILHHLLKTFMIMNNHYYLEQRILWIKSVEVFKEHSVKLCWRISDSPDIFKQLLRECQQSWCGALQEENPAWNRTLFRYDRNIKSLCIRQKIMEKHFVQIYLSWSTFLQNKRNLRKSKFSLNPCNMV